jgi:outer membrane receptor protein involved in Fe transport
LYIPNAPNFIGSFGAIVDNLGPWFGGVEMRWLGGYPLVEDNSLRSSGYKEINLDVGYKINEKMKIQISVFNLFNTHAAASQYAYEYQVSPTAAPQFGATYHPLEPLSARFALTALF